MDADVIAIKLGRSGIARQPLLGAREVDFDIDYLNAFAEQARLPQRSGKARPDSK